MTDDPISLDTHRGMAAQKATEIRRRLREVHADQSALRQRQEEFERFLLAAPATNWPEAAAKAQYLLKLYAGTADAQSPRRRELIEGSLEELARLSDEADEPS